MSKKEMILVVDDNPQNIRIIGQILENNNYEPVVFLDAFKAYSFLGHTQPDLIILDVMMPSIGGFELCKKIKADPQNKNIPVIFLTAKTATEDLVTGFEAGGVDYITKPFKSAELLVRVRTHIELKKARKEIQTLRGIIPICAKCKKIRTDDGIWTQIEEYLSRHTDALFSHGLCQECTKEIYGKEDWYEDLDDKDK